MTASNSTLSYVVFPQVTKLILLHRHEAMSHDHEKVPDRLALVTAGTKKIGMEVCRQLALQGITVILAAKDEERGNKAVKSLNHGSNISNIIFHQLDLDILYKDHSIPALVQHIEGRYGKLDILVAGQMAKIMERNFTKFLAASWCVETNYNNCKWVTKAMLPLLKRSTSGARVVNITFVPPGELKKRKPNEKLRDKLRDADAWDEDRIEDMMDKFLESMCCKRMDEEGRSTTLSMAAIMVNLYTRILARRHPEMRVNCIHTSFDVTPLEEGAREAVKLALLPDDGPTGCYFDLTEPGYAWW
ncbi:hypothetical protein EJB05_10485, partial [Eragrostis curvula]